MKYVSIDIETTGLDPGRDQVLQIAMIVDDLEKPKPRDELPFINRYISHPRYCGNAFALHLNRELLYILAKGTNKEIMTAADFEHAENDLHLFLHKHFGNERITVAGKNAANFDIPFLPKALQARFRHRVLDPGSMFVENTDKEVPNLETCLKRAGLPTEVTHDAYEDAMQVVELIRYFLL